MDTNMIIIIFLLILLCVLQLVGTFILIKYILKQQQHERWELQERIREPRIQVAPPSIITEPKENDGVVKQQADVDEFDLVGKIDPATPLREATE